MNTGERKGEISAARTTRGQHDPGTALSIALTAVDRQVAGEIALAGQHGRNVEARLNLNLVHAEALDA